VSNATSAPDFLDWRRLATDFEALSAKQPVSTATNSQGEPIRLSGKAVTADYFRVFATSARLGRTFTAEEDRPGAARVVVLSHAAWQTTLAATQTSCIGRSCWTANRIWSSACSPRVIVINQALAMRLADVAGMKDPVGKRVRLTSPGYVENRYSCRRSRSLA
jgi:hypothetical protein